MYPCPINSSKNGFKAKENIMILQTVKRAPRKNGASYWVGVAPFMTQVGLGATTTSLVFGEQLLYFSQRLHPEGIPPGFQVIDFPGTAVFAVGPYPVL